MEPGIKSLVALENYHRIQLQSQRMGGRAHQGVAAELSMLERQYALTGEKNSSQESRMAELREIVKQQKFLNDAVPQLDTASIKNT